LIVFLDRLHEDLSSGSIVFDVGPAPRSPNAAYTTPDKTNKLGPIDQDAATAPARKAVLLKVKTANLYYCVCHEVASLHVEFDSTLTKKETPFLEFNWSKE